MIQPFVCLFVYFGSEHALGTNWRLGILDMINSSQIAHFATSQDFICLMALWLRLDWRSLVVGSNVEQKKYDKNQLMLMIQRYSFVPVGFCVLASNRTEMDGFSNL